jgi:tryptophan synthase beta chain
MGGERMQFVLDESQIPRAWYNINADLPVPPPPVLHPQTLQPIGHDFLEPLFPPGLIEHESTRERWVPIPEPIRDIYRLWRPTPLRRAVRLERLLDTPAHIYYKYEGASPAGSHKLNAAVPQAFFNKQAGTNALVTGTGAGQWGTAIAMACSFFDLALEVYMVKVSHAQKPYRRVVMEQFGAQVYASPTTLTRAGRAVLERTPAYPGSLGLTLSETVETVRESGGRKKYAAGSGLGHVLMHQTVIGQEALQQMELAGEYPDFVIACAGGGSNFGGFAFPFLHRNLTAGARAKIIAVEPASCPSMTKGRYAFDWADLAGAAPVVKMHTLGHTFVPPDIHAGGLRYHGMSASVSALVDHGDIEARAVKQLETFEAAAQFSKAEGIIPAPESAHAIRVAIDEALKAKRAGQKKVIAFNLSGHGHFDMTAYHAYQRGELRDDPYPGDKLRETLATLPDVPAGW